MIRETSVKLLQSLRLFEIFLLNYCSAGVTEIYPILIQYRILAYLNTLPSSTLSSYITELYPILIHYRTIPYINTFPSYNQSKYITEQYPILIHCRSIFSHCIKSKQYLQAYILTAGVINSPRRNNYPRGGPGKKFKFFFSENSHIAENTLFHILIHCETIPYPYTLPKTLS